MSLYTMIVADHLNGIHAGNPLRITLPKFTKDSSEKLFAEKTAILLICVGFGLMKGIK